MDDTLVRLWTDLIGRLGGPLTFRVLLQPTLAAFYAVRDGRKDAREGRPPYFWTIFSHAENRLSLLLDGMKAVGRVIALAVLMELAYQALVFRRIYPVELIIVVVLLAFLPYLLVRGPANRVAQHFQSSRTVTPHGR
jgi:hypothetical protein